MYGAINKQGLIQQSNVLANVFVHTSMWAVGMIVLMWVLVCLHEHVKCQGGERERERNH